MTTRPSAVNVAVTRPEFERQRESPTASDYSLGPRQIDPSAEDSYSSDVIDEMYSVADTVYARADESEFKNREALKAAAAATANANSLSNSLDGEADPLNDESNETIIKENLSRDESSKPLQEAFEDNPNTQ